MYIPAEEIAERINSGDIEYVISLNLSTTVLEQAQHLAELISNNELQLPQSKEKSSAKALKRTLEEIPSTDQSNNAEEAQLNDEISELPSCSSSKKLKLDHAPQINVSEKVDISTKHEDPFSTKSGSEGTANQMVR